MRHGRYTRKLGFTRSHRKAMLANLAASVLTYRLVKTTLARAKEVRKIVDKLVSWGKQNDLSARRQAYRILKDHSAVKKLFDEIAPQFNSKQGGYSRVLKAGFRKGDGAKLAVVELLTQKPVIKEKEKKDKKTKEQKEPKVK